MKTILFLLSLAIGLDALAADPIRMRLLNPPLRPAVTVADLLNDTFTTALGAGSVNGTASEPGPGSRTVTDAESKLSLSGGNISISGGKASPAWGDPGIWWPSLSRTAGRTLIVSDVAVTDVTSAVEIGFDSGTAGNIVDGIRVTGDTLLPVYGGTVGPSVYVPTDGTTYSIATVLRAAGAFNFLKVGTTWKLVWVAETGTDATLFPAISGYNAVLTDSSIKVPRATWFPTPLVSDGFTGVNGTLIQSRTSDGLGHSEGNGGSGVSYSFLAYPSGSMYTSNGVLWCSSGYPTAGFTGSSNVLYSAKVTVSTGAGVDASICFRKSSPNTLIQAALSHDLGSFTVTKYVSGTGTALISVLITYADAKRLVIVADGTQVSAFYNELKCGATVTVSDAGLQLGTDCFFQGSSVNGTLFDDLVMWPIGNEGQHAAIGGL